MAEPMQQGADDGPRQEWGEHVRVYDQFTHMAFITALALAVFLFCLWVGSVGGAWVTTVIGVVALLAVTFVSITNPNATWRRYAALAAFIFVIYAVFGW